jgi:hypothetical protein
VAHLTKIAIFERNNSERSALPFVTRFFFHFRDGTDQPDLTGTELASSKAARDTAVVFMGEKLKELDGDFWPEGEWSIRVADETDATVCTIRVTGDQATRQPA